MNTPPPVIEDACLEDRARAGLGCIPPLLLGTGQAYPRRLMLPAERRPVVDGEPRTAPVRVAHAARRGGAIRSPGPDGRRPPHRHLYRPHPGLHLHGEAASIDSQTRDNFTG